MLPPRCARVGLQEWAGCPALGGKATWHGALAGSSGVHTRGCRSAAQMAVLRAHDKCRRGGESRSCVCVELSCSWEYARLGGTQT
eukprot:1160997-Pelagomonas_calceolata.AAC.18